MCIQHVLELYWFYSGHNNVLKELVAVLSLYIICSKFAFNPAGTLTNTL